MPACGAGWKVEPSKVTAAAGERKSIVVSFAAPAAAAAGTPVSLGIPEQLEAALTGLLKGGVPQRDPAGRNVVIKLRCIVDPSNHP